MASDPAPMTPADCDLANFPYMPLDVKRLRDSDLSATADAETFRAAVLLWCASWHQKPAASLPDDDRVLAQFAGFGRALKEWSRIRPSVLRGWIKCSDGRLYHPVVAEKANEAWASKGAQRKRTQAARDARLSQRKTRSVTTSVTNGDASLSHPPTEIEIEIETEPLASASGACGRAPFNEWKRRADELVCQIGPMLNRTTSGFANLAPVIALSEPSNGEKPCDWFLDTTPAIHAVALQLASTPQQLRSWTHPRIAELARANRDRRLNPEPVHAQRTDNAKITGFSASNVAMRERSNRAALAALRSLGAVGDDGGHSAPEGDEPRLIGRSVVGGA